MRARQTVTVIPRITKKYTMLFIYSQAGLNTRTANMHIIITHRYQTTIPSLIFLNHIRTTVWRQKIRAQFKTLLARSPRGK